MKSLGLSGNELRLALRAVSPRYHPSTPIYERLQEFRESSDEKEELEDTEDNTSPPSPRLDRVRAVRCILEDNPPHLDLNAAGPSRGPVLSPPPTRYSVGDSLDPGRLEVEPR